MAPERDPEECECSCHEQGEGGDLHCVPCCAECPFCHRRIAGGLKDHADICDANPAVRRALAEYRVFREYLGSRA